MALCAEIVDLVGLNPLDRMQEAAGVREISIMEDESSVADVRILIEMVDAVRVEQRAAPLDAMDYIVFSQQKLSQIGPVLASDAGD